MHDPRCKLPEPSPVESSWIRLIPIARCQARGGTFVEYAGRELAVFLPSPERVFVIDNACPHAGGNLSAGDVADEVVTCPWHQWQFDLGTGMCVDSASARVQNYPARLREGCVEIQIVGTTPTK
jgi:nitrite reductase (NADH) small subunit